MCTYRFPLKQHVGKEAVPIVAVGDSVARGQLLAFPAPDALSVPIHSSVSGIVTEVTASEIVVNADEKQSTAYLPIRADTPKDAIREAGIAGLGGAGFPTYAKLASPIEGGTVIVNAAECEPILCHNMARIRQNATEILRGLKIAMSIVKAKNGIIAIKEIHTKEISILKEALASPETWLAPTNGNNVKSVKPEDVSNETQPTQLGCNNTIATGSKVAFPKNAQLDYSKANAPESKVTFPENSPTQFDFSKANVSEREKTFPEIRLALLPDLYPMGEERAIIRETLGVLLPPDELPSAANAIVINAETVYRIYEAVEKKKPLIDKDLTIAGKIRGNREADLIQVFLDQPIGISTETLIEKAGGAADGYGELIAGGPFTGKRTAPDTPLLKTTGGILIAECFPKAPDKIGLLVCACGGDEARLRQLAKSLGSEVVGVEFCKQAKEIRGSRKCENPGHCPGQVQKVLALKKAGAKALLISNCTDCSNTVMSCAPQLGLAVYHCTDGALRAVNHPLVRRLKE